MTPDCPQAQTKEASLSDDLSTSRPLDPALYLKGHSHWSVGHQLQHHGRLAAAAVEPAHVAVRRRVRAAAVPGAATRGVPARVREARLLHHAEVLHNKNKKNKKNKNKKNNKKKKEEAESVPLTGGCGRRGLPPAAAAAPG
ncbi:hypothetical protein EYF80_057471 [Liparis tanakae]|uniref:Uncharacterized protein n=1 Tax=Liparis tanakae TaxID=230148 RepID=A0A4Z2EUQ3_9TELE|nr:hypothetical protein EYF80_057471 [Liparis tanakae]